ncbi:hypothetical protein [Siansivirga zeaxanthinifaciens]|uniref:Uncharacterized protein n=1 Tax=Siansivirga zeaxanthinifaciens CC-SAMT-1 TaxID=1454006 RepID=A0A0C5WID3_9FLAO|nr:hypothetical protein [Siansivirga zeaxanthinifaciens]AJR04924.1 hypothetical protein AW14_10785 [Siansivirga zeaxanthinifaciens CC-SAMT-1]
MNKSIIKIITLTIAFMMVNIVVAQQKLTKVSQSINVSKDVVINLNTSYSNIIFDTWNKDVIEIEAYIEGEKVSKEELQKLLKTWKVDIDATKNEVSISTNGFANGSWELYSKKDIDDETINDILKELKFELADIPILSFFGDIPPVTSIPELPPMPKGIDKIQFDYNAYQKDGEKYLELYSKQMETTFGKDFEEKMEAWGEKYAKKMEAWSEQYAKKMEKMSGEKEAQAKNREELKIAREKLMESREQLSKEREKLANNRKDVVVKLIHDKSAHQVKKYIKIKIPKKAKLKVNVRHGEIEFASTIENLKANLSYTKLTANSINGSQTSINASYSPLYVSYWNLGELNANYVKDAVLKNVKQIVLNSNSSHITIDNIQSSAIINGSIGDLDIKNLEDSFTNLNIVLQNSNANISLPKTDYNLQYVGSRSNFTHPKRKKSDNSNTFLTGNSSSGKTILVNAKFSHVVMK